MEWIEKDNKLVADFEFVNFGQAWAFMTQVAIASERQSHHPNWSNVYNKVSISLCTHDAGDIVTEKDHTLAASISSIYEQYIK